jgi:hypothetical protein
MAYTNTHKHGQYMTIWEWWILFLYQHDWTAPVFWGSHHIIILTHQVETVTPVKQIPEHCHDFTGHITMKQKWSKTKIGIFPVCFFPGFMGGHSPTQGPSLRSPTSLWPRLFQRQMPCHLSAVERRLCENVRWHSLWYCGWKKSCTSW